MASRRSTLASAAALLALAVAAPADAGRRRPGHEAPGKQLFESPQSNPLALSPDASRLYVANTTSRSVVGGFEAPTLRGMTDRFVHFSSAFTSPQEILDVVAAVGGANGVIPWNPAQGLDELVVFSAGFVAFQPAYDVFPDDMFQMFEEASTGFSGATGRQLTLSPATATLQDTVDVMTALEDADLRGVVNLRATGLRGGASLLLSFRSSGT